MTALAEKSAPRSPRGATVHPLLFVAATLLMANLSAIVDAVLHPDIPYLDEEHLIVGGLTGLCGAVLYYGLSRITRHLATVREELSALHEYVSICAECKRIRRPDADPDLQESWERIESAVQRMAGRQLSHGLCPMCLRKNFPEESGRREA